MSNMNPNVVEMGIVNDNIVNYSVNVNLANFRIPQGTQIYHKSKLSNRNNQMNDFIITTYDDVVDVTGFDAQGNFIKSPSITLWEKPQITQQRWPRQLFQKGWYSLKK